MLTQLVSMLKDPEFRTRLKAVTSRDNGLHDSFNLDAEGRIKLELYDAEGNIIETREQPNIVVNTARDILIKALAGEPTKTLWLEPRVTNSLDINTLYWALTYNQPRNLYKNVYSSYYSSTTKYENAIGGTSQIYFSPRPYANYTVSHIGLGSSEYFIVYADNNILQYSDSWQRVLQSGTVGGILAVTEVANKGVTFKFKGSFIAVYCTTDVNGAIINVTLDGNPVTITYPDGRQDAKIDLFSLTTKRAQKFLVANNLDPNVEHTLVLTHTGTQNAAATLPSKFFLEGLAVDTPFGGLTSLGMEVPTLQTNFEAAELYNTGTIAPFSFTLLHSPLLEGSEKVSVGGNFLVKATGDLAPVVGQYQYVKDDQGRITGLKFAEQLSGVAVTYQSTVSYPTQYKRALIEKPTDGPAYPYFDYNAGTVTFVAEFPPGVPNYNMFVRELALFDGPRAEDNVEGWGQEKAKMFSIARIAPFLKDTKTGLRITWTISLKLS